MALAYSQKFPLVQIFVVVGDFMIYLMELLAHQIMQLKIKEEQQMKCI